MNVRHRNKATVRNGEQLALRDGILTSMHACTPSEGRSKGRSVSSAATLDDKVVSLVRGGGLFLSGDEHRDCFTVV
jgi:hypothetical protein